MSDPVNVGGPVPPELPRAESGRRLKSRRRFRDRARKGLAVLPSMLTLGNLVCGFYAIIHVASIQWHEGAPTAAHSDAFRYAALAIFLAMIFDMLDGRVARMTRTTSDFGGQLDSLADAVTFGVAPGVMVAMMHSNARYDYAFPFWSKVAWVFGAAYACGAVIRLARFNCENSSHDEDAHKYFKGLPSPAAAAVVATLVLLHDFLTSGNPRVDRVKWIAPALVDIPRLLPFAALFAGYLMVSTFRYVHVANVLFRGRKPAEYLTGLVFGGVIFALFPEVAAAVLCCGFALTGPIGAFLGWMRGTSHPAPAPLPPPLSTAPPLSAPTPTDKPAPGTTH
jgi:CDP-diacylglycerol--serine O-phosphatidyltransferase